MAKRKHCTEDLREIILNFTKIGIQCFETL